MKPNVIDEEFEQTAKKMIAEKRHRDFMRAALAEYDDYRKFMGQAFCDEVPEHVFKIRATYRCKKSVWREIEILGTQTLAGLASCIVESMDWVEDHLHGFWFPDKRRDRIYGDYGMYHEDMEDESYTRIKTSNVLVSQIDWKKYPVLGFAFDFGDGHEFDISLKSIRAQTESDDNKLFPVLIDQRGVAPEQYPNNEDDEDMLSDDCDICQLQKDAITQSRSLGVDELQQAMKKANNEGGGLQL